MAGFFDDIPGNNFSGLLADPAFNVGLGLLTSGLSGQRNLGQGLAQGLQFAGAAQQQQAQNQLLRARLANEARQQAAQERQQAAVQRLQGLLAPDSDAPTPLTPEGQAGLQQQQMLGLLAEVAPEQVAQGLLGQMFAEPQGPTNLEREFGFLTSIGIAPDKAIEALRKGTVVNVGGKPEEPLSVEDLTKVRLPDGSTPPLGTTPSQANAMGAAVVTADELGKAREAGNALAILDQIEQLAVGPDGVLSDVEPGLLPLGTAALSQTLDLLTKNDPAVGQLESLSLGTGASIVRALGERGALSDGDVQRALGLLPQVGNLTQLRLPDTRASATDKLRQLREILERGVRRLNTGELVTPAPAKPAPAPPAAGLPGTAEDLDKLSDDDVLKALGIR